MNNKYQIALDYLYDCCEYGLKVTGKVDSEKETLQELIDNYCKISNELNNLFHEIEFDSISANQLKKKITKLYNEVSNGK